MNDQYGELRGAVAATRSKLLERQMRLSKHTLEEYRVADTVRILSRAMDLLSKLAGKKGGGA